MDGYFEIILLAQVLSAALVSWIIYHYARIYNQKYLFFWSFAFLSHAVFCLGLVVSTLLISSGVAQNSLPRLINVFIFSVAGYLEILFLVVGTQQLAKKKGVFVEHLKLWIALACLVALFVTVFKAWSTGSEDVRYVTRIGIRYLLAGMIFTFTAIYLYRKKTSFVLGKHMVTLCFFLYGIEALILSAFSINYLINTEHSFIYQLTRYHIVFELLVYSAISLSLVIWLLEIERERGIRAAQQLFYINKTDGLTGLANRQGLEQKYINWQSSAEPDSRLTFVLLGLDKLQRINDAEGIKKGDQVLVSMSKRLTFLLNDIRFHGRLHGDVFVAVFDGYHKTTEQKVEQLRQQLSKPLRIGNTDYHLDLSAGVVKVKPHMSLEQVLHMANQTLQAAKSKGGHCTVVFGTDLKFLPTSDLALENELRLAFEQNQFELYYQPIWSIKEHRILSFEALIRWNHPVKGILKPDSFMHILRQLGLMEELDVWVLNRVIRQVSDWQQLELERVNVSLNLSPETIQNPLIIEKIIQSVNDYEISSQNLTVEVTENTAMQNIESGKNTLNELRNLGLKIAIDDFGTGYSSLNYLRSFPSDIIKFDRGFVSSLNSGDTNHEILMALVPLCQRLRKVVVIEGIENEAQLKVVKNLSIDGFQGYYFSYPVSSEKAAKMMAHKTELKAIASQV